LNHKVIYFVIAALAVVAVIYPVAYAQLSNSNSANNPLGCIPLVPCAQLTPATGVCSGTCYIYMSNAAFAPETLNVTVGSLIIWVNNDSITHTSTSNNNPPLWNSNPIPPGQRFQLKVTNGTFVVGDSYYYHCEIHNQMLGVINVVEKK
jgi:plastocyanin